MFTRSSLLTTQSLKKVRWALANFRHHLVVALILIGLLAPAFSHAQTTPIPQQRTPRLPKPEPDAALTSGQRQMSSEASRYMTTEDGYLRYLGAPSSHYFPIAATERDNPEATARNFLKEQGELFGRASAMADFKHVKTKSVNNRHYVRLLQTYAGIPIFGAEIIVQLNAKDGVECVLSNIERNLNDLERGSISIVPQISVAEVPAKVKQALSLTALDLKVKTTTPQLKIFAPSVLGRPGKTRVVWITEVSSEGMPSIEKGVFIDAHTGELVYQYPLHFPVLSRIVYDANSTSAWTLVRPEGQLPSGIADVDNVYDFLGDTYNFYFNRHGRDSIDGQGLPLIAIARYCDPGKNPGEYQCPPKGLASWMPRIGAMRYGPGFAVDDVTGHELTHAVTDYESNLVYLNDAGAINESFSDIWGEFIDLTNGRGNDTASVRWLIGEDTPYGALRSMKDPPAIGATGSPDRLNSPLYWPSVSIGTDENDNGGVHFNSGVNNKLCYLLTDGDEFNGQTVTGMGINRVAALYYEVQTNLLTSVANYTDLYNALLQAAINLNWSTKEINNLYRACAAVEIASPPRSIFVDPYLGPFKTVSEGVEFAFPGNLLLIKGGNYKELVTFDKIMTIKNWGGPVVIGK